MSHQSFTRRGKELAPNRKAYILFGGLMCYGLVATGNMPAHGQSLFPSQGPRTIESPKALALPPQSPAIRRQFTGTGFFVDDVGHLLTARHVVENCTEVLVGKEQRRISAKVVAVASRADLALIETRSTMGIAAVFPRTAGASLNDMLFAGAYDSLAGLQIGGGIIANSRVTNGAEAGHLAIDSPVTFGASGAPVLDRLGLVQGVISRRTAGDRVQAVGAAEAKAFLVAHGIRIVEDDRPQIAGSISRAQRAASISARVTCLQR